MVGQDEDSEEERDIKEFMQKAKRALKGVNESELEISNNIGIKNKKEKQKSLKEMIESKSGESRTQKFKNKVFKLDYTMNAKLRRKKKDRKKKNLEKINKMKIKRVKQ